MGDLARRRVIRYPFPRSERRETGHEKRKTELQMWLTEGEEGVPVLLSSGSEEFGVAAGGLSGV